jgi:putative ABC transport system permease protein
MSLYRQLTHGLRALVRRRRADQEIADEVDHYLEQAIASNVARGMLPDEARRTAQVEFGSLTAVRESVRLYGWENIVETSLADLRYGIRQLIGSPVFTIVAVLTLALGIGTSTAIFSAVYPILFESLPYPHAKQLVTFWDFGPGGAPLETTFGTYKEIAARSHSLEALAVTKAWQPALTGAAEAQRLEGQRVSASYFTMLGVVPAIGRNFVASDDQASGPNVAILSDALWKRRFAGDPAILGHPITLDDVSYDVIGILPPQFENVLAPVAEIWSTMQYDMSQGRAWGHHLRMTGRLRSGVDLQEERREIEAISQNTDPAFQRPAWASLGRGLTVTSLQDDITGSVKPALLAVFGAVLLVLIIASVNVTNLLLARGSRRRVEFAMRTALGAARMRLIRQILTESILLAAVGSTLGVIAALVEVRAFVALSPAGLPRAAAIRVDLAAIVFALAVTFVVGIVVGLVPALQMSRRNLQTSVQLASTRTAGTRGLTRGVLVVAEVALAFVLLVNAGLLFRSLERLFAVDPGFDPAHMLVIQVQTAGARFNDTAVSGRFFDQVLNAVRNVPGVAQASLTSQLPLSGEVSEYGVHFAGDDANAGYSSFKYDVSPDYFETFHIRVIRGRGIGRGDTADAPPVGVISESLARLRFAGQDPIGLQMDVPPNDKPFTIVGVVGDVRQTSLAVRRSDAVYLSAVQERYSNRTVWLAVRVAGDPAAFSSAVKSSVASVDKNQPIVRVATMNSLISSSAGERQFALILFETFALAALILSAAGIYGVLSGTVSERTREIGVRSALGASRRSIVGMVVRQGMTMIGVGIVLGAIGAAIASRAIVTLLFGTSRLDIVTHLAVTAVLLIVSAIACSLPAWRAARVDPCITLRSE